MATDSLFHLHRPATGPAPGLLILLHGVGSNERILFPLAQALPAHLHVVSARAPLTLGADAYGFYEVRFTPQGPVLDAEQERRSRELLARFIAEQQGVHGVPAERTVLLGFSQGAIMASSILLTRPQLVGGIAMLSGRILAEASPEQAPAQALAGRHVFIGHGRQDTVLPVQGARKARELFEALPVALDYHEYDAGHAISPQAQADLAVWLGTALPPNAMKGD